MAKPCCATWTNNPRPAPRPPPRAGFFASTGFAGVRARWHTPAEAISRPVVARSHPRTSYPTSHPRKPRHGPLIPDRCLPPHRPRPTLAPARRAWASTPASRSPRPDPARCTPVYTARSSPPPPPPCVAQFRRGMQGETMLFGAIVRCGLTPLPPSLVSWCRLVVYYFFRTHTKEREAPR